MSKISIPGLCLALLPALVPVSLNGADFHPISSITSSTSGTDLYLVSRLIQGPGTGFSAAEPHQSIGGGSTHTWVTAAPNGGSGDYFSNGIADPVLVIDLGENRTLSEISTWGYANTNTNGGKDFTLRFATSTEGTGGFGSSISYSPEFEAAFSADNRDSHPFAQSVTARYVELTFTDNWRDFQGGTAGGDRVGLGEIAFEDAVPPIDPLIQVATSLNLDFDGSVQTFEIPVANLGATQNLTLSSFSFNGTHSTAFSIISAPASIAPATSDTIQISFNPTGLTGNINATLDFTTNDSTQATPSISLSGFIHDPRLEVAGFLNFGSFPANPGAQDSSLTLSNIGGGQSLTLSATSLTGTHASNFTILSAPSSIAPLASDTISIRFDPLGNEGIFSAQLEISSNDALNPLIIVNLSALVGDAVPTSGVRINEFMASNGSSLNDGDGNSSDWIELFNAGPGTVDLSGWHLTDESNNLSKWAFPDGTTLAANTYLIVFASGQLEDTYVDNGGFLHTNFKLTTEGEYLGLIMPDGATVVSEFTPAYPVQFSDVSYGTYAESGPESVLTATSDADVLVPADGTLGLTWTFPTFTPDASWITNGTGQGVGFDGGTDYNPYIDIDIESQMRSSRNSAYIRLPFTVADASALSGLKLTIRYDDGFYAYLNGTEIASRNAPANPTWNSVALGSINESANLETIDVSAFVSFLQNGNNVLAIHGLNQSANSSDFLIDPVLTAIGAPTGPLLTGYLSTPTPGSENTGGSANPGPEIPLVSHSPSQPSENDDIIVTAVVAPRLVAVGNVDLHYRIVYGAETTIPMVDDGTGPDAIAGDFVYTATIPATNYGSEDMVRWFVTATDAGGDASRSPAFLDQSGTSQSPEYYGTVTTDPSVTSDLPIFQWFTNSLSASHSRAGARTSVYFLGKFYDNLYVRQRGGFTNAGISQKFSFNKGDSLYINEEMPSVGEININGNGADSTFIRQPLSFDTHRAAGNESSISALWQLRVNGASDRVGVSIEQVDEDYLERYGYDGEGDLYKFVQRSNLNPVFFDTTTGIEKKTGDESNLDSLADLVSGLKLPTSDQRRAWIVDNLDIPQIANYLASRAIIQDADDLRKNFYMFLDTRGDERWRLFPWDKDFTFGVVGDGGTFLPHPFFGDEEHKKQNADQWNILYDVFFEEPVTQRIYLRRLRTLMDELLQPASTPLNERILESMAQSLIDPASPPLGSNISSINSYLNSRRSVLFNNYPALIPDAQPSNPGITFASVEANPASGNQDQEFVELTNSENTEIDISGWSIEGGIKHTFRAGTVIERNGSLYVSPDSTAFLARTTSPKAGEEALVSGPYSGHLSNFSEVLTLKNAEGVIVDTFTTPDAPTDAQRYLVLSEVMYHPADPNPDAEFVELKNISDSVTLDLGGVHFTDGIDFTFAPGTSLAPGECILVVLNLAAFEAVHGTGLNIAGVFQNGSRLNNGSDYLKLEDASNSSILEFTYDDKSPWPTGADGLGFSLVLINPGAAPDPDEAASWRESTAIGGNPGTTDATFFTGNPDADLDGDGINALLEYAYGTSDNTANSPPLNVEVANGILTVTATINHGADDISIALQRSTELGNWADASADLPVIATSNHGDGTTTLTYQSATNFIANNPHLFLRLQVELLP